MGSFLAAGLAEFRWEVFILTMLTTVFLQILSNLSNDYGDYVNGADHEHRQGPSRAVQSGAITPKAMRNAILVFITLSLISGVSLLLLSLAFNLKFLFFLVLGIASIAAAIYYTMGKNPYGYAGLGDISVFLFFGWLGVCGTYVLHTGNINYWILLPATSCSLFAVAVLNVNNIRDIESDKLAGKKSIPVRIGRKNATIYHILLLVLGVITAIVFSIYFYQSPLQFLFLLVIPFLFVNGKAVVQFREAQKLDPYLKQMALSTLLFVVLFGIGLVL